MYRNYISYNWYNNYRYILARWDKKERKDDSKIKLQERIGKYMVVGGCTVLVVYAGIVIVDFYELSKCLIC